MRILNWIIILALLTSIVSAQVQVTKESQQEVRINSVIEITIHISNPNSFEEEFIIEEVLPRDIEVIDPSGTFTRRTDGIEAEYYKWAASVSPNSIKTLTYSIRPTSLGDYTIGETIVTDSSGKEYYSNPLTFTVKCSADNQCSKDENYITCPEDCKSGLSDGICDYSADSICDPDCVQDPDCQNKEDLTFLIYIFAGIVVIILLMIILPKLKKPKNPDPLAGIQNSQ